MKEEKNLSGIEVPKQRMPKKRRYHYHAFLWTARFWGWIIPSLTLLPALAYWALERTVTVERQASAWIWGNWVEYFIAWTLIYFGLGSSSKKLERNEENGQ